MATTEGDTATTGARSTRRFAGGSRVSSRARTSTSSYRTRGGAGDARVARGARGGAASSSGSVRAPAASRSSCSIHPRGAEDPRAATRDPSGRRDPQVPRRRAASAKTPVGPGTSAVASTGGWLATATRPADGGSAGKNRTVRGLSKTSGVGAGGGDDAGGEFGLPAALSLRGYRPWVPGRRRSSLFTWRSDARDRVRARARATG